MPQKNSRIAAAAATLAAAALAAFALQPPPAVPPAPIGSGNPAAQVRTVGRHAPVTTSASGALQSASPGTTAGTSGGGLVSAVTRSS